MKLSKNLGRIATTFLATAMLASLAAVPAMAAANVQIDDQVIFDANLDMTNAEGAGKPNVNFTYTIDDNAQGVAASEETPEIKAGKFPTDTENVTARADWASATFIADADSAIEGNQPCYSADVKMTFPAGTFTEPGIYRFTVTPDQNDTSYAGVDVDTTARYIDVYVAYPVVDGNVNQNAPVVITAVQLLETNSTVSNGEEDEIAYSNKLDAFENAFSTYDVTVKKEVAGQMGDKGQEFDFDIDVTDPNASLDVLSSIKVTETDVAEHDVAFGNGESGTTKGVAHIDASLKHNETVLIKGVPTGTTVKVAETNADGYVVTYSENASEGTAVITADNTEIKVTNTRDAVSPTGIAMDIAPYALLVVVAAAGCFVFLRKRRED